MANLWSFEAHARGECGLPEIGDRVRVWPFPGHRVQDGPRPIDHMGGGRWLPKSGKEVIWDEFTAGQLRAGALLLHPPPCDDHAHAEDGKGDCHHCGRSVDEAQKYDVLKAQGIASAKAAQVKPSVFKPAAGSGE